MFLHTKKTTVIAIEVISIFCLFGLWLAHRHFQNPFASADYFIDILFVTIFLQMILFRSSNPRHYWYGFFSLFLTIVSTLFRVSSVATITASLALAFFILGLLNQVFFNRHA